MNKKIFIVLLILQSGLLNAQQTREEKLQQLKHRDGVKVTEVEKDIIKVEYPNGKTILKNIADYQPPTTHNQITYSPNYDSTIIDLRTIDTTLYYQKYSFWQEVPLGSGPNKFLLVGDVNNNNLPELYGKMKDYTSDYSDIVIFEENTQGGFDSIYSYDRTNTAKSIYDIDKDGMDEVHLRRFADTLYHGNSYLFFKKDQDSSLATNLSFVFYPFEEVTQQNNNKFGDWDGDSFTDQIFHLLTQGLSIFEYNPQTPNFDSVYFYDYTTINLEFAGFAINDFDQDGNTEFFTGSTHGDVLCIENTGDNSYAPTWTGMVETYNAYQLAQTNDIDSNGKKEIWVGGDAFYPGIGSMTRITLFESDGNDSYQVVGRIDLLGIFSFFAQNYQAVDVDKDGVEEMMVCIEQTVLILKFNGSPNHQTYELFYFKQNDFAIAGRNSVYHGARMNDLINDSKEEIIINLDDVIQNVGLRLFSFIYKPNFTVDVKEPEQLPEEFNLYPNFPNPFNPTTQIRFKVPEYSFVSIKVYNSLGKEIKQLLEKNFSPGNYTISWDSKGSDDILLPSGVYFIRLSATGRAEKYTKTIKAVLLK